LPSVDQQPVFEPAAMRSLMLDMAQQRAVDAVLDLAVRRLTVRSSVALARIWLAAPGDVCASCRMRPECPDQTECLHLAASAGGPLDGSTVWDRLDGRYRRFPFGVRKVGRILAEAAPVDVLDQAADSGWIVDPDWAKREGIRGFGGQPLVHRGKTLGVLAVFTRRPMVPENLPWLRMVADHAAAAIANARAFEEIDRLQRRLELENEHLREEVRDARGFGDVVGSSDGLRKVLTQVDLVAAGDTSVLVAGESGTGKELIARAIHERSERRARPLVTVNCASIPHDLFESEFFGHVKGAFTGAARDRIGRFQLADSGSIFLDEVGEIPLELQGKLLRVLQEGTFERVGDERTRKVDVRVIAATNKDLEKEAAAGRFREDLYYRLSVFPIDVPPLRKRVEDVALLARHFLESSARRLGLPVPSLKKRHAAELEAYPWPGNVRELQNVVERAVIRSRSGPLEFDLPGAAAATPIPQAAKGDRPVLTQAQWKQLERDNLRAALEATGWRVSGPHGAAVLLGMKPTTLASRIRALRIER